MCVGFCCCCGTCQRDTLHWQVLCISLYLYLSFDPEDNSGTNRWSGNQRPPSLSSLFTALCESPVQLYVWMVQIRESSDQFSFFHTGHQFLRLSLFGIDVQCLGLLLVLERGFDAFLCKKNGVVNGDWGGSAFEWGFDHTGSDDLFGDYYLCVCLSVCLHGSLCFPDIKEQHLCVFQTLKNNDSGRGRDISNVKLKNVDKKLADLILSEIVDSGPRVDFKDVGQYVRMQLSWPEAVCAN